MRHIIKFGGPETIGLSILGATVGRLVGGAATPESSVVLVVGAVVGAVVLPALVAAPWRRLRLGRRLSGGSGAA